MVGWNGIFSEHYYHIYLFFIQNCVVYDTKTNVLKTV